MISAEDRLKQENEERRHGSPKSDFSSRILSLRPPPKSLMKMKRTRSKPKVIKLSPSKSILKYFSSSKGVLTQDRDGNGQTTTHISRESNDSNIHLNVPPSPHGPGQDDLLGEGVSRLDIL